MSQSMKHVNLTHNIQSSVNEGIRSFIQQTGLGYYSRFMIKAISSLNKRT